MKKILTAAAVVASMALVACGGSSDKKNNDTTAASGGSSNKAASYSDFSKQIDAICTKVNTQAKPQTDKLNGQVDNDATILSQAVPQFKAGLDEARKLQPPAELKPTFDQFIAVSDEQLAAELTALTDAEAQNQDGYTADLQQVNALSQKSDELGSKLGAAGCAGANG
jgi:hypothetical protein